MQMWYTDKKPSRFLMKDIVETINKDNFAEKIEMDYFIKEIEWFFKEVTNSSLRKIYESYLIVSEKPEEEYQIEKQIWIARLSYQEKRKSMWKTLLPAGLTKSLKQIEEKIWKNLFKKFMEVFIAYHKYLWGKD